MSTSQLTALVSPPSGDFSVKLMNMLLGNGWQNMFGGSAGHLVTMLGQIFQVANTTLLLVALGFMLWQLAVGAMQTAHEGVALGKRYHSIWAPLRAPVATIMLAPFPGAGGYSFLQAVLLSLVFHSVGAADTIYDSFLSYLPAHGGEIVSAVAPEIGGEQTELKKLLENVTLAQYINRRTIDRLVPTWDWQPDGDGQHSGGNWVFGFHLMRNAQAGKTASVDPAFGTATIHCSAKMGVIKNLIPYTNYAQWFAQGGGDTPPPGVTGTKLETQSYVITPARDTSSCRAAVTNVNNLIQDFWDLTTPLYGPGDPAKTMTHRAIDLDLVNYALAQNSINAKAKADVRHAWSQQVQVFSDGAKNLGWASSAFFWWELAKINYQANQMSQPALPEVTRYGSEQSDTARIDAYTQPDQTDHYNYVQTITEGHAQKYIAAVAAYYDAAISDTAAIASATAGKASINARVSSTDTIFTPIASKLKSRAAGQFIGDLVQGLESGSPIVMTASHGHELIEYGSAALGLGAFSSIGGSLGGFLGHVLGGAGTIAMGIGGVLVAEGAFLAYVVPFLPSIIMIFAIVGWLVLVIEMLVAAPLWAATHVSAVGEGLAPQASKIGYATAAGVVLRPVLLTFGFIFSLLLIKVAGYLFGVTMQVFTSSLSGSEIGVVQFVTVLGLIATVWTSLVYFVMRLITHLAQHVPVWLGGNVSADLGVDQAATGAAREAQSGYAKPMIAAGGAYAGKMLSAPAGVGSRGPGGGHGPGGGAPVPESDIEASDTTAVAPGGGGGSDSTETGETWQSDIEGQSDTGELSSD